MRDILFKAKRVDNGEWVEGSLIDSGNHSQVFIYQHLDGASTLPCRTLVYHGMVAVDADTICQYTGLTDKNGHKIWENDLIEVKNDKYHFISQIEWDDWCKGFMFQDTQTTACGMDAFSGGGCYYSDFEVIGNIFDNKDLMGE